MEIVQLVLLFIIAIPLLVGAKFRSLKDKNEKNQTIGIIIQTVASLATCIYVFGIIIENVYAFYISLGIVLLMYIVTYIYIYIKYIKK